ncbi:TonB-dependent receptor domain-containing protein [Lusitaniella coriacea]|uniref:TonB-dependent receptor domain-containing protein n=1 Tax=Lusitaniella coriacea TaxID=1983105 RepID=UPI003CF36505
MANWNPQPIPIWASAIASVLVTQSVYAQTLPVTDVRVNPSESGFELILEAPPGVVLEAITSTEGNRWIADIENATLELPDGESFRAENPVEGIEFVTVTQGEDGIQVIVAGTEGAPNATLRESFSGIAFDLVVEEPLGLDPIPEEEIEIVVTATRTEEDVADVPRSVTTITREEIEEQTGANSQNNISDIIGKLVPGLGPPVQVNRRVRGQNLRGRPALILIDGVVQNTNITLNSQLNAIDPSVIERIEVVRGPIAAYGGGATGGIINIITRKPTTEGIESTVTVGTTADVGSLQGDGFGFHVGYGLSGNQGIVDYLINFSWDKRNGFFDAEGDRVPAEDISNNQTLNLLAKVGIDITEEQRLVASYNVYQDRIDPDVESDLSVLDTPGLGNARAIEIGNREYENQPQQINQVASLTYSHDNLWGSKLDAQLFYQSTDFDLFPQDSRGFIARSLGVPVQAVSRLLPPTIPVIRQGNIDSDKWGGRLQVDTPVFESASLLWGIDYTRENNNTVERVIDPVAFDRRNEVRVLQTLTSVPNFQLDSIGLFAQLQWDVSEQWRLDGGFRYENISVDVQDYTVSPFLNRNLLLARQPLPTIRGGSINESDVVFNLGTVYKVTEEFSVFANFAQGFAIPSLQFLNNVNTSTFNLEATDLLEPEKVNNYELGVRGDWENWQFTIAGFYNHSDRGQAITISRSSTNAGFREFNRAPQNNYGIELTADWQPTELWGIGGTFTWNEGNFDPPGDNRGFIPLSSLEVQPIKLTLYVENETLPNWNNRLQLLYVGGRDRAFEDGVDAFKIESYATVDFLSTVNIGQGKLQIAVENLFDNQYLPVISQTNVGFLEIRRFPASGRTISLRYSIKF